MSLVTTIVNQGASIRSIIWRDYDIDKFSLEKTGPSGSGGGTGIAFSSDGTKFYKVDAGSYSVFQYSVATPFDATTLTYDNVSFVLTTGVSETSPNGITFKPDGTKMYICGHSTDGIIEYALSTPWDLSTASYTTYQQMYDSGNNYEGLSFKPDGTKVYLMNSADTIVQWSLSTAWDIDTLSYDNVSLLTNSQDGLMRDIFVSSDGTKIFTNGISNDNVYQYTMTTPWDLSTASYDNKFYSYNSQSVNIYNLTFHPDGSKFYLGGTYLYQYSA